MASARLSRTLSHLGAAAAPGGVPASPSGYRYTFPAPDAMDVFSAAEREFYDKNGYIVVKGCVPAEDLRRWDAHFLGLSDGSIRPHPATLLFRDVTLAKRKDKAAGVMNITKVQNFEFEPLFSYCRHPSVLRHVRAIIGPNVKSLHTMLINKPPDTGAGTSKHPLHQDLWYFPFRPAELVCAAWTAMQTITTENGCLVVVPGSHTSPLFKHGYPPGLNNVLYHGITEPGQEWDAVKSGTALHMEAGDTVFFHPRLIHGSGPNLSAGFRRAISCHFASADCEWIDVKGTIQEEVAKEIEDSATKRGFPGTTFVGYWQSVARLVCGAEGTLS